MSRSPLAIPSTLVALSLIFIALPSAWTETAKFYLLGIVRAAAESANPDTPGQPSEPQAQPEGEVGQLREQNQIMAQKVARLQEENTQLRAELQNLRDFRRVAHDGSWELLPAPIPVLLSRDPSSWNRTLLIARGSDDGVKPDDVVVWGPRLVGRIHKVTGPYVSQVRLVTDRGFRIPVVITSGQTGPAPSEPLTGILEGQGLDTCALHWIMQDTRIEVGWPVLTLEDPLSNTPPYLLVGRVSEVEQQAGPFLRVRVRPVLKYSNLSQVHVYKRRSGAQPPATPAPAPPATPRAAPAPKTAPAPRAR